MGGIEGAGNEFEYFTCLRRKLIEAAGKLQSVFSGLATLMSFTFCKLIHFTSGIIR